MDPNDFVALDAFVQDANAWDDRALIDAFDAAVRSYKKEDSPARKSNCMSSEELAQSESDAHSDAAPRPKLVSHLYHSQRRRDDSKNIQEGHSMNDKGHHKQDFTPATEAGNIAGTTLLSSDSKQDHDAMLIPPPPPHPFLEGRSADEGCDGELEALLIAWYEAGYRAGRYAARQVGGM